MADWRERGYVPDSDEEEDESLTRQPVAAVPSHGGTQERAVATHNDLQPLEDTEQPLQYTAARVSSAPLQLSSWADSKALDVVHASHRHFTSDPASLKEVKIPNGDDSRSAPLSSVAEQLQASLQRGLDVCESVKPSCLPSESPRSASDTDSPLSSPPGSIASSPKRAASPQPLSPHPEEAQPLPSSLTAEQWQSTAIVRSFRPRTAVQLQPYTLDVAKHRTEWQSRGLRPVHLAAAGENQPRGSRQREEESQGDETFASSPRDPSPARPRLRRIPSEDTPMAIEGDEDVRPELGESGEIGTDDELPDIADILRGARIKGHKMSSRRRLISKKPSVLQDDITSASTELVRDGDKSRSSHKSSLFDLPPSPPRSGSLTPVGLLSTSLTPRRPPTPVVSSDRPTAKRNFVEVSSSPEQDGMESATGSQSSGGESTSEEPQHLVHIRRRIRGVLPASWLRLDAQQQKSKPEKPAPGRSPEKRPSKGVARQISRRPASSSGAYPAILDIGSDGEESDSSQQMANLEARSQMLRGLSDSNSQDVIMDDAMEDNTFDRMLPATSRGPRTQNPRKKRQQRLHETWTRNAAKYSVVHKRLATSPVGRLREAQPGQKRQKRRSRLAELSILDAPGLLDLNRHDQPSFLRVAARSKTAGRHARTQDPAQKFFQLATSEDTVDVNNTLSDWRRVSLKARKSREREQTSAIIPHRGDQNHSRQLSRSRQRHQQQTDSGHSLHGDHHNKTNALQLLKTSTDATLARLQHRPDDQHRDLRPSTTLPISTAPPKFHAGFVSWHGNRAGRGNFWSKILSRPAQLETPALPVPRLRVVPRIQPSSTTSEHAPTRDQTSSQTDDRAGAAPRSRPRKQTAPRQTYLHSTAREMKTTELTMQLEHRHNPKTSGAHQSYAALARVALTMPTSTTKPPAGLRLNLAPMFLSGHLTKLVERSWDVNHEPPSTNADAAILRTPTSKRSLSAADYSPELVSFIREIFSEAMNVVVNSRNQGLVEQAGESVDTVIVHIDMIMKGSDGGNRKDLIVKMAQILEESLTFLSSQAKASPNVYILTLHNRAMILVYQIFSASGNTDTDTQKIVAELWSRTRLFALELIIGLSGLKALVEVLSSLDSVSWAKDIQVYIEGFFLWYHLARHYSAEALQKDVLQACSHVYGDSTEACMAVVITLLPVLYTLSYSDTTGLFQNYQVTLFEPWTVLGHPLRGFLETYSNKKAPSFTDTQLGLKILKCCLSFATNWSWPIPDSFLQLLYKYYGKNDMIELFVTPDPSIAVERVTGELAAEGGTETTDFELFLRLVTTSLTQKSTFLEDESPATGTKAKIMSLVFSLTPNNCPAVDEEEELQKEALQTMGNTYALYATLFSAAPKGCRPRVTQVENLARFSTSHAEIRDLIIAAWARMSLTAVTKGSDQTELQALEALGSTMWEALASKITKGMDATALENSFFKYDHNFKNCEPVLSQIRTLITHWTFVIDASIGIDINSIASKVRSKVLPLLQFLQHHFEQVKSYDNDTYKTYITKYRGYELDMSSLNILRAIQLKEQISSRAAVFHTAHGVLLCALSVEYDEPVRLERLIRIWFDICKVNVGADQNQWDLHLQQGGKYSFPLLATTTVSRQCEALFLSLVIKEIPTMFELDPEELYIRWLRHVLKPEAELCFEHLLTNRVVLNNPGNLRLDDIIRLGDRDEGFSTLQAFILGRHSLVREIIHSINQLQFNTRDDSQDLIELPIDVNSGRRLLKVMTDVLKGNWSSVPPHSDPAYTRLVQASVQAMQVCPLPGFTLDPWFTNPEKGDFIVENRFRQFFTLLPGSSPHELDDDFITRFRVANQKACNTPLQETWVQQMVVALSSRDLNDSIINNNSPAMDDALQIKFMQNVLSVYVQFAFSKGSRFAVWSIPVIQILTRVNTDAHFRPDLLTEPSAPTRFANMCLELLMRARQALDSLVVQDGPRRRHVMRLAISVLELATVCLSRIAGLAHFDHVAAPALEEARQHAIAIYDCVTDSKFDVRHGPRENLLFRAWHMEYKPSEFKALAVEGTVEQVRKWTVGDIDEALSSGRLTEGLGESWSAWLGEEDSHLRTHTGWEEDLEPLNEGGEVKLKVLAEAVEEFRRVGVEEAGVLERGDVRWRVWEVLGTLGFRGPVEAMKEQTWHDVVVERLQREGVDFVDIAKQGLWKAEEFEE